MEVRDRAHVLWTTILRTIERHAQVRLAAIPPWIEWMMIVLFCCIEHMILRSFLHHVPGTNINILLSSLPSTI